MKVSTPFHKCMLVAAGAATISVCNGFAPTSPFAARSSAIRKVTLPVSSSGSNRITPPAFHTNPNPNAGPTSLSLALPTDISTITNTLLTTIPTTVPILPSFLLNASGFVILQSKLKKMLTPEGFYHSLALGTMLWHTLGWQGWTTCVLYLFCGSLVTKVKFQEKEKMGIAEGRGGRRGPENVWGSAATALICAAASVQVTAGANSLGGVGEILSNMGISYELLVLAYVSSLATKLADTFASEIGKAYGKTTFLITTFERVAPGTEGAVSLEGTVAAAVGGSILPIYAYGIGLLGGGSAAVLIGIATFAAFMATNAESLIGATMQGKKGMEWMTNEVVNFFNTVIGAGIAIGLGRIML